MSRDQATIFLDATRPFSEGVADLVGLTAPKGNLGSFEGGSTPRWHFGSQTCARPEDGPRGVSDASLLHSRFASEMIPAFFLPQGNELHPVFADTLFNSNLVIQTEMTNRED